jgi:hypothetical protein
VKTDGFLFTAIPSNIKRRKIMRRSNNFLGLSIMFFVFAIVFSIIFWPDVSLAAQIGLFALGFGSGAMAIRWFNQRNT